MKKMGCMLVSAIVAFVHVPGCGTRPLLPQPPTVVWGMVRAGGADSLEVAFTATGTDLDGGTVRYLWDFKDGTIVTEQNPSHLFQNPGFRQISLSVIDDEGQQTTETLALTVPLAGPSVGGERAVPNEGEQHVPVGSIVNYQTNPPASGAHYSAQGVSPLPAGVYRTSDGVRPEQWVHNLEHGYVVVLYECNGACTTEFLDQLQAVFEGMPLSKFGTKKLVIAPYAGLSPAIMAIAWDVQRDFSTLDSGGLVTFYQRHVDRGPEDLP